MKNYAFRLAVFAAVLFGIASGAKLLADTGFYMQVPAGVFATGDVVIAKDTNSLTGTTTPTISGSLKIGSSGTSLTQVRVFTLAWTPSAVAAGGCATQTTTLVGVTNADVLVYQQTGAPTPPVVSARPSGTNTIAVTFCNPGNVAQTPAAHTATIVGIRS